MQALKRKLRVVDLAEMDEDGDGEVNRGEFLAKMLVKLGKCAQDDVDEIMAQFNVLDVDRSGTLDAKDIANMKTAQPAITPQT